MVDFYLPKSKLINIIALITNNIIAQKSFSRLTNDFIFFRQVLNKNIITLPIGFDAKPELLLCF